jgi:hypothetical protein
MLIVLVLVEKPHLHEQFNEGRAVAAATRGNVSRNNEARSRGGKTSSLKRRMKNARCDECSRHESISVANRPAAGSAPSRWCSCGARLCVA